MKTHEFWQRVNEALDARRDPLDDEAIQRELEQSPELLEEFASLRSGLEVIATSTPTSAAPRVARSRRVAAAAALLLGCGATVWFLTHKSAPEAPSNSTEALPTFTALPCDTVLAFSASITVETPYERVVTEYDGLATDHPTTTVSREQFAAPHANPPSPYFFASITTQSSSR